MEAILLLFFGYILSRAFTDDKPRRRDHSRRRSTSFWDDTSYSAYVTWRKSHGDQNVLF